MAGWRFEFFAPLPQGCHSKSRTSASAAATIQTAAEIVSFCRRIGLRIGRLLGSGTLAVATAGAAGTAGATFGGPTAAVGRARCACAMAALSLAALG